MKNQFGNSSEIRATSKRWFFWRSERKKRNFQVFFMTNSSRETVILEDSFERARKNHTVEKQISWKKPIRKKSYDHFSEKNFQKKIENFQKKKFQKCYFIFKHGEKKKFFFWKIFRPRFRPKFWKCHILLAARILRKIFPKFFFIHIILP